MSILSDDFKLVILDCETVTNGDVSLKELTDICKCEMHGFTPNENVAEIIGNANGVICNKCLITREVFEQCPNLKYVGLFATGYNNIDLDAAKEHSAVVCNVPGYSTNAVAQHTFSFILNYFNRTSEYAETVDNGDWVNYKLFSYFYIQTEELAGKTLGIIGFGNIGRKVCQIAKAFGMNVVTYTRSPEKVGGEAEAVDLDTLLEVSDIVSLHCPLNKDNQKMIDGNALKKMKNSAILVNTARGGLVDEYALTNALNKGEIAHACIDALTYEPMREDCPLRNAKNCTITPHIAWAPKQTRERLIKKVAENVRGYLNGNVINNVAEY